MKPKPDTESYEDDIVWIPMSRNKAESAGWKYHESMTNPTQSDKTVEQLVDSFDVDWYYSSLTARDEAIAALTARENRMVQEAVRQRLTEYRGQPLSFYQAMQRDYGDEA